MEVWGSFCCWCCCCSVAESLTSERPSGSEACVSARVWDCRGGGARFQQLPPPPDTWNLTAVEEHAFPLGVI